MSDPTGVTATTVRKVRRRAVVAIVGAFVAGLAAAGAFWRKQVFALMARAVPYARRKSTVEHPVLIINRWSGDGRAERVGLADAAKKIGLETIMLERGDDLATLAENAIAGGADAIGMAGGDGSLAIVASVAVKHDLPFFCVPVGTRNHFALDLGLDRDNPLTALDQLNDGEVILIDHGDAGGRFFLNNVSFGVYAQAVHQDGYRENKEETMAKVLAGATANRDNQAAIRYSTPDGVQYEHAPMLLISNNPYHMSGPPDYGRRLRLDSGNLGIGAITNLTSADESGISKLEDIRAHQSWEAPSIRLESDETILAGLDGEAVQFDSPVDVSVKPKALKVLVPAGTKPGYVPRGEAYAARVLDIAHLGGDVDS